MERRRRNTTYLSPPLSAGSDGRSERQAGSRSVSDGGGVGCCNHSVISQPTNSWLLSPSNGLNTIGKPNNKQKGIE